MIASQFPGFHRHKIDADIRALVLRFGEDCVLVWSNDKNFMAFLSDHATATRLIEHNSTSPGAVMVACLHRLRS
ncbi:NF-X1-type zinc finger protein NFXL1 [Platanthera guangdongensis]|uniref:NF-X1-type zinc finger protein NFXL1 n=1 Tax=Platanthera guangdongensis TaxID=2320717 RepID=A0ABR2LGR2_9ASPA